MNDDEQPQSKPALSTTEMFWRREAIRQADAINRLSGYERGDSNRDLDEKWIRGEMTTDEVVAEVLRRYRAVSASKLLDSARNN